MSTSRLRSLCWAMALLAGVGEGAWRGARAQDPDETLPSVPAADGSDEFAIPPGDPWYPAAPQQRGPRPTEGDRLVFKMRIVPHWFDGNERFWYRNDLARGAREFIVVDARGGTRQPAFDHERLANALSRGAGQTCRADRLPFDDIDVVDGAKAVRFRVGDVPWECHLDSYECVKVKDGDQGSLTSAARPATEGGAPRRDRPPGEGSDSHSPSEKVASPDGKWRAFVKDHDVFVAADAKSEEIRLSTDGKEGLSYGRLSWSPDSKTLVAFRIEPGDRKEVYLVQSSPPGGGRARLRPRPYPLPGDKFAAYELNLFDVAARKSIRPEVDRIDYEEPRLHWHRDGRHFSYEKIDRGHQRFRLIRVDSQTGETRRVIDEKSETFIWTAHRENVGLRTVTWLDGSGELIYASERDGWRHLYLIDATTGAVKNPITRGSYVVRGVDHID